MPLTTLHQPLGMHDQQGGAQSIPRPDRMLNDEGQVLENVSTLFEGVAAEIDGFEDLNETDQAKVSEALQVGHGQRRSPRGQHRPLTSFDRRDSRRRRHSREREEALRGRGGSRVRRGGEEQEAAQKAQACCQVRPPSAHPGTTISRHPCRTKDEEQNDEVADDEPKSAHIGPCGPVGFDGSLSRTRTEKAPAKKRSKKKAPSDDEPEEDEKKPSRRIRSVLRLAQRADRRAQSPAERAKLTAHRSSARTAGKAKKSMKEDTDGSLTPLEDAPDGEETKPKAKATLPKRWVPPRFLLAARRPS